MQTTKFRVMTTAVGLFLLVGTAMAGPPLICHTYSIGNETSLPWGTDKNSWNNPDPKYDTRTLTADTLKLLDSGKPLLVRMETLRRAAIYAGKNSQAGMDLATALMARALTAEVKGPTNSQALFDARVLRRIDEADVTYIEGESVWQHRWL